jgi:DNA-binding response OmpR family regulator
MHIGIVEDEPAIADMLVAMLELERHQVTVYRSGWGFLQAFSSGERYDVLLLDVGLPDGISGLDILQTLALKGVQLPVLILTAAEYELARVHDIYPVVDLLRKPFRRVTLFAHLERLAVRSQQKPAALEDLAHPAKQGEQRQEQ